MGVLIISERWLIRAPSIAWQTDGTREGGAGLTCKELKEKLRAEGIPGDLYSIQGLEYDQHMCLLREGDQWFVFWSERGLRHDIRCFLAEADACEAMYERLKRYATK